VLEAYAKLREFLAVVPTSLRARDGIDRVLDAIADNLPSGEPGYDTDFLTDRATPYFVREYVREGVLKTTLREVPHAVAVSVDAIDQLDELLSIKATIHVEKEGQRRIVVGKGGATIKAIGTGARKRLEELAGQHIFLELFVRVSPRWKDVPRQLAELGYQAPETPELARVLPDAPRIRKSPKGRAR
jgi:GTP-binding protein Era